jgi:uncharacterized protein (TIGR03118 family)
MLFPKLWIKCLFGMITAFFLISGLATTSLALTPTAQASGAHKGSYEQTNLVSDLPGVARFTDPNLVNPWGIAFGSGTPFWVADNGTGLATTYNGSGQIKSRIVTIPLPLGSISTAAAPTGIVFNKTDDFVVSKQGKSSPARFIFATEDGTISGWNPNVDPTNALLVVDRSNTPPGTNTGAVYKGLARGRDEGRDLLFATNFRAGVVDVFNAKFRFLRSFTDSRVPQGFAPFGIRNIDGLLYVTFAKQDDEKHDDVAGPGNGFVDIFETDGHLVKRLISRDVLNSPWGLTLTPSNFGPFSNDLLVGNFGDSTINAFNPHNGEFLGTLKDEHGNPLGVDDNPLGSKGLWGLTFGNGIRAGDRNTLFFTSGIDDEAHGLFASIEFDDN